MDRRMSLVALAALTWLAGCETTGNLDPSTARLDPTKGLVLLSVSHDWGPPALVTNRGMGGNVRFHVEFHGEGLKGGKDFLASAVDPGLTSMWVQSDFEQLWGRTYVRELPPGRYEFVNWRLTQLTGVSVNTFTPKAPPPPIAFQVEAGSVTYVGNVHAELVWGKNPFGVPLMGGGRVVVRDEAARDLPLIVKAYPALQNRAKVNLLPLGVWAAVLR